MYIPFTMYFYYMVTCWNFVSLIHFVKIIQNFIHAFSEFPDFATPASTSSTVVVSVGLSNRGTWWRRVWWTGIRVTSSPLPSKGN